MANGGKKKRLNVVILETDPTYLRLWEKIFRGIEGCSYNITNDIDAASDLIKKNSVDLVISEVVLEKGDGYKLAAMTHRFHPKTEVLLTTGYDCDLARFSIENPRFHLLHKPYNDINNIQRFIGHLLNHENLFEDVSEDSFSENDAYPDVMEWKL